MSYLNVENVHKELKNNGLTLREHQIEGIKKIIEWYDAGHGGILADEMGLGKTCQSIIAVLILMSRTKKSPCLIICPLSVLEHWTNEIKRFSCGAMKVFRYYETRINRIKMRNELKNSDWNVVLTTYETFLNDYKCLPYTWEFVIFDESQRLKFFDSLLTKALRQCNINWMLSMTGTPVQNNMSELFSLLNLVDNRMFPNDGGKAFVEKYNFFKNKKVAKEFHELFGKYCLRRSKLILHDIPPCEEIILNHGITDFQRKLYTSILSHNRNFFFKQTKNKHTANQSLLNVFMQLRKVVNHPYLFKGFEKEPYEEGEHLRDASGKLLILERLLQYLFEKKHKVLIFSQFVSFLNIIYDYLLFKGYNVVQLDGGMKLTERQEAVGNFQRKDSDVFAFLLSTRAGGIGLNLMAADTVIFVDWDMNPQMDKQAAARCHRIGQVKPVKIIRLLAKHTVDEIIETRVSQKLLLSQYVMGKDDDVVYSKVDLLTKLLLKGLKELEEDENATIANVSAITNKQLEGIIGKTLRNGNWDVKKKTNEDLEKKNEEEEIEFKNSLNSKSYYQYNGHDYTEDRMLLDKIAQSLACGIKIGTNENVMLEETKKTRSTSLRRAIMSDEERKQLMIKIKQQAEKKKMLKAEKKAHLWINNNYKSLSLAKVKTDNQSNVALKIGQIYSVQGNIAKPVIFKQGDNNLAIILYCCCNKAILPYYGLANSLRQMGSEIPDALSTAKQMQDIYMGDCHLVNLYDDTLLTDQKNVECLSETDFSKSQSIDVNSPLDSKENVLRSSSLTENIATSFDPKILKKASTDLKLSTSSSKFGEKTQQSLNLAVGILICCRTKKASNNVPQLSLYSLENALCRVGKYAAEHKASIHMPQIWYNQKVKESEVRYIIRKTLCRRFGVDVYIYYFKKEIKVRNVKAFATMDNLNSALDNQNSINSSNVDHFNPTTVVGDSIISVDNSKCTVVRNTKALDMKYNSDSEFSNDSDSFISDEDDSEEVDNNSETDEEKKEENFPMKSMVNAEAYTYSKKRFPPNNVNKKEKEVKKMRNE